MRREGGHAPAATAWAGSSAFTRESNEALERALAATKAGEAPAEDATPEHAAELFLDETRQAGGVRPSGSLLKEGFEM
jgi:hypothetical protein